MRRHKNLSSALTTLFPEHNWELQKFIENQTEHKDARTFLLHIQNKLNIQNMEDWYKVSYFTVLN